MLYPFLNAKYGGIISQRVQNKITNQFVKEFYPNSICLFMGE